MSKRQQLEAKRKNKFAAGADKSCAKELNNMKPNRQAPKK
jgi:hypothetical protein